MQRNAVFKCSVLASVLLCASVMWSGAAELPSSTAPAPRALSNLPPTVPPATAKGETLGYVTISGPAGLLDLTAPASSQTPPLPVDLPAVQTVPGSPAGSTHVAQQAEPAQPAQPAQPTQPPQPGQSVSPEQPTPSTTPDTAATTPTRSVLSGLLGGVGGPGAAGVSASASPTQSSSATASPAANVVSGGDQALTRASSDAGDLLSKSAESQGVQVQRRSPIVTDPRVRGYYDGQLTVIANGAFFSPARYDLDTVVSKIDSSNIENVVVVKGPYSVRYGPGFAFLDIETLGTPRYQCFEGHGSSSITYQTNGEQWRGRQSFWGGESNWGFRLGYDVMEGSDYETGAGFSVPSRYSQQDVDFAYGLDFSADSHLEFKAMRLRQRNVELPGTLTDINALVTEAYTLRYTMEHQPLFNKLTVDAWYNYTHFNGDDLRLSKRLQIPQLNDFFNGVPNTMLNLETQGDSISRGFREAMTWGEAKKPQFTLGVDLNYLSSYLDEFDTFVNLTVPTNNPSINTGATFASPIPRARLSDPGIFMDAVLPLGDCLILKAGARVDLASTQVEHLKNITAASYMLDLGSPNALSERNFELWSAFATADYSIDEHWKLLAGCGFAEIPPTLTQLYADTPFLAIVQNGFNYFLGNPDLSAPQDIQMDFGVRGDFERFRTGISFYYAWIHNYITYELFDPEAALLAGQGRAVPLNGYRFVNTELASLAGGEFYGEYDVLDWLTPFGLLNYTEGRDLTRNGRDDTFFSLVQFPFATRGKLGGPAQEPLPGIYPIEARLGLRLHQPGKSPRWGVEFTARIVGNQDRVAESLLEKPSAGFTIYNLRSYWQVNKNFLVTAGVENLTDHFYREPIDLLTGRGVFQPGINFYFGAKLEY